MQATTFKKLIALALLGGAAAAAGAQGLRLPGQPSEPALGGTGGRAAPAAAPAPAPASPRAQAQAPATAAPRSQSAPAARPAPTQRPASAPSAAGRGTAAATGAAAAATAAPAPASTSPQLGDAIVAVVNNDVITRRELDDRVKAAREGLAAQGIPAPDNALLERQILERMITDKAQLHAADRAGIRVSDEQIDMAISRIAEQNNISLAELRQQVETDGISWNAYRNELRDQIRMTRLREQEVDRNIIISEAEIDAFLADQAAQQNKPGGAPAAANGAMHLAQILVRVPEGSSPEQITALRNKAENLLRRARSGEDFAQLAAGGSDGEEALQGGDMGIRPMVGWPDLFLQAVGNLQAGQVSDIVQSGNGFHILKVVAREGGQQAAARAGGGLDFGQKQVTQHHVRHILVKTSAVVTDEEARARLSQIADRIRHGQANFADMARQYSDDASAPQGGELGWISPGETVPAFERAMEALQPGQMSEPVKSEFGWHLILVEDRRVQDVTEQARRLQARQILFQRKLEPAWEEWVGIVRGRAYVDNRLGQERF